MSFIQKIWSKYLKYKKKVKHNTTPNIMIIKWKKKLEWISKAVLKVVAICNPEQIFCHYANYTKKMIEWTFEYTDTTAARILNSSVWKKRTK